MNGSRLSDVTRYTKSGYVREYFPETAEEAIEEIRARIAQNNKAATRVLESKESEEII